MPVMNKDELVIKLAEEFGISTIDIYQFVNTVIASMEKAFIKGKNINIPEFGKFNVLTRKNGQGKPYKTLSFSPVRKFAEEVNFRFNDLSSIPLKQKPGDELEKIEGKQNKESKQESINYTIMSDKDKYDDNFIRDEFPEDSSMDAVEAFIKSKLEKGTAGKEVKVSEESSEIREFELPHTIIQLHNDITGEEGNEEVNLETEEIQKDHKEEILSDTPVSETPSGQVENDLAKIIEERKKALEQSNVSYEPDNKEIKVENKFTGFSSFEDERNAELNKIIEERNKIISDINSMVDSSEKYVSDEPKRQLSNNYEGFPADIEEKIEETLEHQAENPQTENLQPEDRQPENSIEMPLKEEIVENSIEEEKHVDAVSYEQPVQENENTEITNDIKNEIENNSFPEDHTNEHKPAIEDNFDPIITSDEVDKPFTQHEDLSGNDILINEDVEKIRQQAISGQNPIEEPKSFEDVFETKREVTANDLPLQSEIQPPVNPVPPPVKETYQDRMQKRRELYEKKESGSTKKALWLILGIVALIVLIVFLYNYFITPPPPVQENNNTTQNNQQPGNEVKNTPPPVTDEKKETPNQSQQTEKTTTPTNTSTNTTPGSEEIIPDNALKIVYVRTSEGFYIQTGSFKDKSVADSKAKLIKPNGKTVAVKEADLGDKGTYYRVRIGVFKTQEEAKEFAAGL